jgi:hypothetical protein
LADLCFYEDQYDAAFENYKKAYELLSRRLGGYARLTDFQGEVDWLSERIMELADTQPELAISWSQAFREYWESKKLIFKQSDLLISMCDVCEVSIRIRAKDEKKYA